MTEKIWIDEYGDSPIIATAIHAGHGIRRELLPLIALDVRENVKFEGRQLAQWIHSNYPDNSCVLSVEFKKFYMDEWTGCVTLSRPGPCVMPCNPLFQEFCRNWIQDHE